MNQFIDRRIAELERELAGLRRQKLAQLESEMAILQASLDSATPPATVSRRGRPPKGGRIAGPSTSGPKRRGRKRGKRISEEDALASLTSVVRAAGKEGLSARAASQASGIFYPRVIKLMDENFRKSGRGKWTRYTT